MEPQPRYFVKPSVKWCAYYYVGGGVIYIYSYMHIFGRKYKILLTWDESASKEDPGS